MLLTILVAPIGAAAADFQTRLDRAGIPYLVPQDGKAILVNIPAFELIAFEDGRPVLRSRVIVGTPWNRTPRLQTFVSAVRFRPTWRPTPSMIASGEHRDRIWPPGERNPLGLAAVRLAPGLLVYLHDTNHRELFAEENRALSHGCVRVEQWQALVSFVLDMDLADVNRLANGRRTFDSPAPPIPVELGYYTRFVDELGRVVAYPDIYRLGASSDLPTGQTVDDTASCEVASAVD
ncbi:L,D-transpeptidase family protein [Sulfitobacter sp. JBTF-M27]|uniref:L,D-transpeptidase family protein n=1 Tax=Sulfitobacter sediminilitoris TaxID=2698830 RepID=A0A6P0CE04_9RHOB|nr:L,D-transpeptidase family protein [Sulfitobacter sediminilitoris]NEK23335.1 L,D-transpeptidase family protein [Sulfitobacter sediminilitoris]